MANADEKTRTRGCTSACGRRRWLPNINSRFVFLFASSARDSTNSTRNMHTRAALSQSVISLIDSLVTEGEGGRARKGEGIISDARSRISSGKATQETSCAGCLSRKRVPRRQDANTMSHVGRWIPRMSSHQPSHRCFPGCLVRRTREKGRD